jgi:hypothetical protein
MDKNLERKLPVLRKTTVRMNYGKLINAIDLLTELIFKVYPDADKTLNPIEMNILDGLVEEHYRHLASLTDEILDAGGHSELKDIKEGGSA